MVERRSPKPLTGVRFPLPLLKNPVNTGVPRVRYPKGNKKGTKGNKKLI